MPVRRPFRIVTRGVTVLSLILFVATVALWVRSYRYGYEGLDGFYYDGNRGYGAVYSWRGGVWLFVSADRRYPQAPATWGRLGGFAWEIRTRRLGSTDLAVSETHRPLGVGYEKGTDRWNGPWHLWVVSDWLLCLIFASTPTLTAIRAVRRRRRWRKSSLCRTCGYDLRATPDRCPECGARTGRETGTGTVFLASSR
jgi:hypothetical protein